MLSLTFLSIIRKLNQFTPFSHIVVHVIKYAADSAALAYRTMTMEEAIWE